MRVPTAADTAEMELSTAELKLVIHAIEVAPLPPFDQGFRDRMAALRERFAGELDSRLNLRRKNGNERGRGER